MNQNAADNGLNWTIKDVYGSMFHTGCKVAFNYSGQVRLGILHSIKKAVKHGKTHNWNNEPYYTFVVKHDGSKDITSKISCKENLVVIPTSYSI